MHPMTVDAIFRPCHAPNGTSMRFKRGDGVKSTKKHWRSSKKQDTDSPR